MSPFWNDDNRLVAPVVVVVVAAAAQSYLSSQISSIEWRGASLVPELACTTMGGKAHRARHLISRSYSGLMAPKPTTSSTPTIVD